jgi:hypothetical protein
VASDADAEHERQPRRVGGRVLFQP